MKYFARNIFAYAVMLVLAAGMCQAAQPVVMLGQTSTGQYVPLQVDSSGNLVGLGLPTGAATAANQATANTTLAAIQSQLTTIQSQLTSMQAGTAVTGTFWQATQPVAGNVASGATDSGNPVKTGGVYNSSPITLTNGQRGDNQLDSHANQYIDDASLHAGEDLTNNVLGVIPKAIIAPTYTPSIDVSFGTATTHNSKATAGLLAGFSVSSINPAIRYFQVFNSTGSTVGTPILSFPIPAGTSTAPTIQSFGPKDWGGSLLYFSTGLTWGISTSANSYVAATNTDHQVHVFYY